MAGIDIIWSNSGPQTGYGATWGCQCVDAVLDIREEDVCVKFRLLSPYPIPGQSIFTHGSFHFSLFSEFILSLSHVQLFISSLFSVSSYFSHPFGTISTLDLGLK